MDHFSGDLEDKYAEKLDSGGLISEFSKGKQTIRNRTRGHSCDILSKNLSVSSELEKH